MLMRILHIISTLDPAMGGPSEGVRLLLSQTEDGCTGEVVTLDAPDAPFLQDLPFVVHALGPVHTVYAYSSKLLPWLLQNRHRFDGFLLNGMWQYCGLAVMLAARRHIPYMVFAHGMLDPYFKRRFPRKHLKKVLYWYPVEFWVLRRAWRVLFTTELEQTLAKQSFALSSWKAEIVAYGVQAPTTPVKQNIEAFHAAVPALGSYRYLLFLGRIHHKKGCDMLVRAFCELTVQDPELHLLMAGPDQDDWGQKLRDEAAVTGCGHRIHWPGILRDTVKWGAFQAAEAFILPSHQENFGIAVAEALACGCPVLLSDQVNLGSLIDDAGCAMMEPDTLDGTKCLLLRWMKLTDGERKQMGLAALKCFATRFDLREAVEQIDRLFRQAAESGKYRRGGSH